MKIELNQDELDFLFNIILEKMADINKTKQAFNLTDRNSPKAKYFKDSFWEIDNFVHSVYNKLNEATK